MKHTRILRRALAVAALALCAASPALAQQTDTHKDFVARQKAVGDNACFAAFKGDLTADERRAMEFLYAYMPLPDLTDYPGDFYLANVRASLQAKAELPWGKAVPEREFRHFVLPPRVNNENLDASRPMFYEALKDRVKGMTMEQAALEVNHWCHERVTYAPSDARTSSPLASIRTALGRCGEESTFAVAALRAVGIPARQVYTPRWAHTDDNHAWVEAWVDGRWVFFGACEPAPVVNLGWFNNSASRAMLVHTKVFGKYDGPEQVIDRNNCYTEIAVTDIYAPVATVRVKVVDASGKPVPALVEFKVYNYGEFYTVAKATANAADGMASLTCGKGDLLVWASHNGRFGFKKASVGKDGLVTVTLDKDDQYQGAFDIDIVPPAERNSLPDVPAALEQANNRRLAYEDSLRNAYVETFLDAEEAKQAAAGLGCDADETAPLLVASRGNHAVIEAFLKAAADKPRAVALLKTISEKDLRDIPMDILLDHYGHTTRGDKASPLYDKYVLNPRVANEWLTPYKAFFNREISDAQAAAYRANPEAWVDWVSRNIRIDADWNPQRLDMSPISVWKHRATDAASRDLFFVAAARGMGIPAQVNPVTLSPQWADAQGRWHDVAFGAANDQGTLGERGVMKASFTPAGRIDNPKYYIHFSLSKLENGRLALQNYPEDGTWESILKPGTEMQTGSYLLVSGTRLANGGVLAHLDFLPVRAGETTETALTLRHSDTEVQVIGSFNAENLYDDEAAGVKSLLSTTGRGYYVLGIIAPNEEPTNHALKDIARVASDFERWGRSVILLFKDKDDAARFTNRDEFRGLPSTVRFGTDVGGKALAEILASLKLPTAQTPIFLIADTFNRVVFVSQGYTINLGDTLLDVIHKL